MSSVFNHLNPVNAAATPEARALLASLQALQGRVTLSGQHNQMARMSETSAHLATITGQYPLIWGGEWGFSDTRHPTDDIAHRPRLLEQIRLHHARGCIIVLSWHQACPTIGEPCTFEEGVKCTITDAEWREMLTPGMRLNTIWYEHVDRLAEELRRLCEERIPIIFRPYHEMNGEWFWWGARPGRDDFEALWRMLYRRLVDHHHLDNLLWAWCSDRPWAGVEAYYPGDDVVDILGADIYPIPGHEMVFRPAWFDRMHALAAGKPLALTECSVLPTPAELERQPWLWFMGWDNLVTAVNSPERLRETYQAPRVRSLLLPRESEPQLRSAGETL